MWEVILAVVVVSFTAFYFYVKYKMSYWRRHGVAEDPGFFPFGGQYMYDMGSQKIAFTQMTDAVYKEHPNAPVVGTYGMFGALSIVIRDLDIAKLILVKDFDKFMERRPAAESFCQPHSKNNKYFPKMLLELRGDHWKQVRSSLTPVFTSGKLKSMMPLIHQVADNLDAHLAKNLNKEIEMKELMASTSLDVIISTGFGYELDSFNKPENVFLDKALMMSGKKMDFKFKLIMTLAMVSPRLLRWLDLSFLNKEGEDFFVALIKKAITDRRVSGERRNDLIDICLDILEKEKNTKSSGESISSQQKQKEEEEVETVLIANSLLMFLAGFDTVSTTSSIMLYYMAKYPECQDKLYEEICKAVEENGESHFDYQTIMNMPYLDMVLQESQRMYPLGHLERASGTDYKIPGTEIVIPKGIYVRIAVSAVSKDENFFPNPEVFNPENFTAEKKANRHSLASGGFGHGPRNCIAQRFATMEVKILVARLLHKYRVEPCSKTVESLIPDPVSTAFLPKGGVWATFQKR